MTPCRPVCHGLAVSAWVRGPPVDVVAGAVVAEAPGLDLVLAGAVLEEPPGGPVAVAARDALEDVLADASMGSGAGAAAASTDTPLADAAPGFAGALLAGLGDDVAIATTNVTTTLLLRPFIALPASCSPGSGIDTDVRDLQGALTRLISIASVSQEAIDLHLAENALCELVVRTRRPSTAPAAPSPP